MSSELERFFKSIDFEDLNNDFKDTLVEKVVVKKKTGSFEVFLVSENHINPEAINKLLKKSKKGINGKNKVNVKFTIKDVNSEFVIETFNYLLKNIIKKRPCLTCLKDNKINTFC